MIYLWKRRSRRCAEAALKATIADNGDRAGAVVVAVADPKVPMVAANDGPRPG